MPTKADIDTLHIRLSADFKDILTQPVQIAPLISDWHKVVDQSDIWWFSRSTALEYAYRERGGRVEVFQVSDGINELDVSPRGWLSWGERWVKIRRDCFDLKSAGWTAFWGPPYDDRSKVPVLRAEWDQLDYLVGTKDMGQPHWHVDHALPAPPDFLVEAGRAVSAGEIAPEVTEAPLRLDQPVLRIGQVHLAMAAWEQQAHPQCWQRGYGGECDRLRDWATKTLRYLKSQLDAQRGLVQLDRAAP